MCERFILCLIKSSFYTVKQYWIIAYGAFLQSRLFVIRRFVVSTFCSCRRFDIRCFVFRCFVFRRFVFRRFVCAPIDSRQNLKPSGFKDIHISWPKKPRNIFIEYGHDGYQKNPLSIQIPKSQLASVTKCT
jgi:hypothetical protein